MSSQNSTPTVVFITGVARGIGEGLLKTYLARPNHVVIGSVRDATSSKYDALKATKPGPGSKLLLVSIESTSLTDAKNAVEDVKKAGIEHIDLVIANAGWSPDFASPESVDPSAVTESFQINALGPLLLFQATKPLLDQSSRPSWASISTVASSNATIEAQGYATLIPYGAAKAALNFITTSIRAANPKWIVSTLHPGWLQTDMGNAGARGYGMEQAPQTLADGIANTVAYLDKATRETNSGFLTDVFTGDKLPY